MAGWTTRRRTLAIGIGALLVAGAIAVPIVATTASGGPRGAYELADGALIDAPADVAGAGQNFYFVMTDRFANGDASNDTGGLTGDRSVTGFDSTDSGYYEGGDLAGLRGKLDYIQGLGTTALWLTPSFVNKPVQGVGPDASAGYHGYWVTDFTRIDPHLGTNDDLAALIADAHARGMKVYFDIITNHTADVIGTGGATAYIPTANRPYLDTDGDPVDLAAVAGSDDFPELDAETSFPYPPHLAPGEEHLKVPDWLNDPTLYHNRGNTTWRGESVTLGDFSGLDDLMTENPRVVDGFVDVYSHWIDVGIDGFRIDTVKHVNLEFWQAFTARVLDYAHEHGHPDFFLFGEVYDADPAVLAPYLRDTRMNAVLDFGFQDAAVDFVNGSGSAHLADLFAADSDYTTARGDARALPTFLGNHDLGRIGYLVRDARALERDELAHELMYFVRGQPVVYAGDEQGFAGAAPGTDKSARQSLFASRVPEYVNQQLVTGELAGSRDRYDTQASLYRSIAALAALRARHPALANGAQVEQLAKGSIYAFSRIDRVERVEYLVVANGGEKPSTVEVPTLTRDAGFDPVYGTDAGAQADAAGRVTVTVPPLSAIVLRADRTVSAPATAASIRFDEPVGSSEAFGLTELVADTHDDVWRETSFAWRIAGSADWHHLGTATGAHPRVLHDVSALEPGTHLEYRAVTVDAAGHRSAASTTVTVIRG